MMPTAKAPDRRRRRERQKCQCSKLWTHGNDPIVGEWNTSARQGIRVALRNNWSSAEFERSG